MLVSVKIGGGMNIIDATMVWLSPWVIHKTKLEGKKKIKAVQSAPQELKSSGSTINL